jgi:hypothetical protein
MSAEQAPARALGTRELVDAPVGFIREHFKLLAGIALIGDAVGIIPGIIYQALSGGQPPDLLTQTEEFGRFMALTYGTVATQHLIWLVPTLALYAAVAALLDGRRPAAGEVYGVALTPRLYFTYLQRLALIAMGLLCCGVPSVAAGALLALLAPVMIHEGLGGLKAIKRAYHLVWFNPSGRFVGSTLFAVMAAGAVYLTLSAALNTAAALPSALWGFMEGFSMAAEGRTPFSEPAPLAVVIFGTALGLGARVLLDLYPAVAFTLLYREVVSRHEGEDLEAAIRGRLGDGDGG